MEAPLPPSPALTNYKFGVRMGDPAVEARDGMIALFGFGDNDAKEPAGKVDLRRIYTDYMPKPGPGDSEDIAGGPLKDTRHTHHIHLSPTWPDPLPSSTTSTPSSSSSSPSPPTPTDSANHYFRTLTHPHHTTLYAAIVEPWLPVSISSGILPASRIQIPRNHVRTGIGRLATFIRAGPTLVDGDIAAGVLRTEAPGVLGAWEGVHRGKRGEVEEVDGEWVWVQRVVHARDRDGKDGRGEEEEEEGESVAYNKYVVKPREPAGVVWGRKTAGEEESEPGRAGFVTAMEGYWWRTGTKDIDGVPAAALKK